MSIYFDSAATAQLSKTAAAEMAGAITAYYGNPSSLHTAGLQAKKQLDKAKKQIAGLLSCEIKNIIFTSGATESNNTAIFGAVKALKGKGKRIVTTDIEHPSVSEPIKKLEAQGYEVVRLHANEKGVVDGKDVFDAITKDTILVSIMLVNNEVGSVQPVEAAKIAARRVKSNAIIHCDASQGFGKLQINPEELGIDIMSISAHKIGGPKGIGALYIRTGVKIAPLIFGGGQEGGLRGGTENVLGAVGFGAACFDISHNQVKFNRHAAKLRGKLVEELANFPDIYINSPHDAIPSIINFSIDSFPSEVVLNFLSTREIYVSSGSACSKGNRSTTLSAMGLPVDRIDSAIRISFAPHNTEEEIDEFIAAILQLKKQVRKSKKSA